jgi:hypothetical protein
VPNETFRSSSKMRVMRLSHWKGEVEERYG